jgi:hypothetical protein
LLLCLSVSASLPGWATVALAQEAGEDVPAVMPGQGEDADATTADPDLTPALRPLPIAPPRLEQLPGQLLIASTRDNPGPGDTVGRYRLYTLRQGAVTRLHFPDEELGSTSAALSQSGRRLLVNAAGQALHVVDVNGAVPPQPLLGRLPPLSFSQTDAYLSIAWSADESQALVVRPHPRGMSLVSLPDGGVSQMPLVGQAPSFSPDGRRVAFAYTAPGQPAAATYVARLGDDTSPSKVTGAEGYETAPAWLGDGKTIAYVGAAGTSWEVRAWDSTTNASRVIARAPAGQLISSFAVAPGSEWIAYTLQEQGGLHRQVRIGSTADPSVGIDLPQTADWNDRVLGWVNG